MSSKSIKNKKLLKDVDKIVEIDLSDNAKKPKTKSKNNMKLFDVIGKYKKNANNVDFEFEENTPNIKKNKIHFLEQNIDRGAIVSSIDCIIHNINTSIDIEKSIFKYALIYSREKRLNNSLMICVYNSKHEGILKNIQDIIKKIKNKEFEPKFAAFMSPEQINEKVWELQLRKATLRKNKKENMAVTDIYKCKYCKQRKSQVTQRQTRSADEPMTTFVTCLVCSNTFKF